MMNVASISPSTQVGRLASEFPVTTRIFARHGIDFCCGGGRPIEAVCRERGLDVDSVLTELREVLEAPGESQPSWNEQSLAMLVDHIVHVFHDDHREELPRLEAMANKVRDVHGARDPERFEALARTVSEVRADLEQHMLKEERVLFPLIAAGHGANAAMPIAVMMAEHDQADSQLQRIRELTNDYQVPPEACTTWRALWSGLEAFERDLHEHVHLENNILFPRALGKNVA